jgi:regulator of sigma E protease
MLNIIGALVALGILVTVHEFGHFIAARIFKVEVEKFSIGFGPKLFSFKKGITEFRISLIPLGGYLKMKGENPDEKIENDENSFKSKLWWQRAIIAFSGPFANFILALLISS